MEVWHTGGGVGIVEKVNTAESRSLATDI